MTVFESRFASVALLLGAVAGAVLAASGLFEVVPQLPPGEVMAKVNDWPVQRADFDRMVSSVESGRRSALTNVEKRQLLDRMIEEKLLLQRGLELGLVNTDPAVRKAISDAMIQSVLADVSSVQADADDLADFFAANQSYFARPARLQVRQMLFRDQSDAASHGAKSSYQRAMAAGDALNAGQPWQQVEKAFADSAVIRVPAAMLPPHKLRDYIGPALLQVAEQMQPGDISDAQRHQNSYVLLQTVDSQPQKVVEFNAVKDSVVAEFKRRAGDRALRDYLDMLRSEADIRVVSELGTAAPDS